MRRIMLSTLLLFWCSVANAQEVGLDFLGIKSRAWNCDAMMAAVNTLPKPIPCGAFLDDTFGTSDACLRRLLASGKCSSFRGHLAWTNHKPLPASALVGRAQYLDALAASYSSVTIHPSAICEHGDSASQSAARNAALKPYLSHCGQMVDSGMSQADATAIRECHGPFKKCTAVSLDGQDALDYDVEAFKRNGTLYSLLWGKSFNCKFSDKDKRPPNQRTDCPTQDQFNHYVRLLYPQPPFPPGERLTSKQIYKPSADNHGGCKGKDCKPVYITNSRQPRINITALDGRQVGWLKYYGPYDGIRGAHRYYLATGSGQSAFQLGQDLERLSGSDFGLLHDGRSRFVFNAYRRGGASR
jgi:hypothetical protein